MFMQEIRQFFPDVGVSETHPKALWSALKMRNWNDFSNNFSVIAEIESEHKRDDLHPVASQKASAGIRGARVPRGWIDVQRIQGEVWRVRGPIGRIGV